jgi:putative glutamine amidotransferase
MDSDKKFTLYSAIFKDFYPFDQFGLFTDYQSIVDPDLLDGPGMLVVWGGEDISPSLYNCKVSKYTGATMLPSRRDQIEWRLMKRAVEIGMPIIGICRGAQMLCALAGGKLIQHVQNHGGYHNVNTFDGKELLVNSLHHQMMYPFEVDHEMVAWSSDVRSSVHYDVDVSVDVEVEPEFVYFPKVKGYAVQWHPEMMRENAEATSYICSFMKEKHENK